MIFFGWGRKSVPIGEMGMHTCARCAASRPFRLMVNYNYFHLYWFFGAVLRRRYLATCAACGQGVLIGPDELPFYPLRNPIPFMRRWGLAILLAGIALACALLVLRPGA